jgi:hypothetical protein
MADVFLSYSRADRRGRPRGCGDRAGWPLACGGTGSSGRPGHAGGDRAGDCGGGERGGRLVRGRARFAVVRGPRPMRRWTRASWCRSISTAPSRPCRSRCCTFLRFTRWSGEREQAPWPQLRVPGRCGARARRRGGAGRRRPDPGGVPIMAGPEPALQGFGRVAVLGWAALATAALLALCRCWRWRGGDLGRGVRRDRGRLRGRECGALAGGMRLPGVARGAGEPAMSENGRIARFVRRRAICC